VRAEHPPRGHASKLEPLSADYNSMDGLNVHMVNIDEMHAHEDRGLIDVLETATGARRQPLVNKITTAGDDPVSPCGDEHDYACKILDGVLQDETYFAFIASRRSGRTTGRCRRPRRRRIRTTASR
jgi:phage terminase large subunit-like protein